MGMKIQVYINLSAINFSATLGVWSFGKQLLGALSRLPDFRLIGICLTSNPIPDHHHRIFDEILYVNNQLNDDSGVELLLHHFQEPLTKSPYVVMFYDLHLWDVPWKYGSPVDQQKSLEYLILKAAAVVTMFPRTYFDLPKVLSYVPNSLFLTISPTMIDYQEPNDAAIEAVCGNLLIEPHHEVIVYPGQYQIHKNHINLFKAIKKIKNKNIRLICPGSEFKKSHTALLQEAIKELQLSDQITLAGYLADDELSALLHRTNLIVSASLAEGGAYLAQEAFLYHRKIALSEIRSALMHLKLMRASIPTFNPLDITNIGKTIEWALVNPQNNDLSYQTISKWTWEDLGVRYKEILLWVGQGCPEGQMPMFGSMELGATLSNSKIKKHLDLGASFNQVTPILPNLKPKLEQPQINDLLSVKAVASFEELMQCYNNANINLHHVIDGGAGSGSTSKKILSLIDNSCYCYAFEPFEGNHRFFPEDESRLILIKKALADKTGEIFFRVPGVVSEQSAWGKRGMAGYSSGGHIVNQPKANDHKVGCVRADDAVPDTNRIGFVKLDLQGGELNALKGMPRILNECFFMWIEFLGQKELIDFLIQQEFIIYDTEYLFYGEPSETNQQIFEVSRSGYEMSNGRKAWFGFRKKSWNNFVDEFKIYKHDMNLVQTDLVCVNKKYIDEFIGAVNGDK